MNKGKDEQQTLVHVFFCFALLYILIYVPITLCPLSYPSKASTSGSAILPSSPSVSVISSLSLWSHHRDFVNPIPVFFRKVIIGATLSGSSRKLWVSIADKLSIHIIAVFGVISDVWRMHRMKLSIVYFCLGFKVACI
jgi:hypothetical protein